MSAAGREAKAKAPNYFKTFNGVHFTSAAEYKKYLLDHNWREEPQFVPDAAPTHQDKRGHGHHADPLAQLQQTDAKEGFGDYHLMNRFSYLFDNIHNESLLKKLARKLTEPRQFSPDSFDLAYYEALSEEQKRVRVLLALEKLNHLNHHCFSAAEKRLLTPSNQGVGSKLYSLGANAALFGYFCYVFVRRKRVLPHLLAMGAFGLLNHAYLQQLPLRVKEHFRISRALKLAESYYAKHGKRMELFAQILSPHTSPKLLEHLSV